MRVIGFVVKVALILFLTGLILGLVLGLRVAESVPGLAAVVGHV